MKRRDMYLEILGSSIVFALVLLLLAHNLVLMLNRAGAKVDSLADGLAASMFIGSAFSGVMLAYPVILYCVVSDPGGLFVGISRGGPVMIWVVACFVAALLPGSLYFVRVYRPYPG